MSPFTIMGIIFMASGAATFASDGGAVFYLGLVFFILGIATN